MKKIVAVFYFLAIACSLYSQTGTIQVTSVSQRTNGSGIVDIYFNLNGPGSTYNITLEVSFNGGGSYAIIPANYLTGVENGISPGSNKHIVWDGLGSFPNNFSTQTKLKITANEAGGGTWPPGTVHCSGTPTAIVDVTNPATGKIWMDRNLGASRAATSSADAQAYGDLYQWGRFADGHQCRNSATTSTLSSNDTPGHGNFITTNGGNNDWRSPQNNNLWQVLNGINNPCPSSYRIPTEAELNAENQSWSSNNAIGAFNSPLKLPVAAVRDWDGSLIGVNASGFYWSAGVDGIAARTLVFGIGDAFIVSNDRASGSSVRCIKDTAPTQGIISNLNCGIAAHFGALTQGAQAIGVSSTVPYIGGNGGHYNGQMITSTGVTGLTANLSAGTLSNGNGTLIFTITGTPVSSGTASFVINIGGQSCFLNRTVNASGGGTWPPGTVHCAGTSTTIIDVTNPATGKTWMDRNLGASRAATSSTDTLAYGDLYQWGRFADGHQCRYSPTTYTLSSSNNPGHGNFILAPNNPKDWRSPQNSNLWQGVNGINNPCPIGYRLPTDVELNIERQSWSSNNATGAFNSPLKLPVAGERYYSSGSLVMVGNIGQYSSSTIFGTLQEILYFRSDWAIISATNAFRARGSSVRCLKDTSPAQGTINTLDCNSATNNGTLTQGISASNVSSIIAYTGGNGGTHNGQTITSTGVTGLTATLGAGSFVNGNGTLTYTISGTPTSSGTASFALNIGGQSCTLSRTVNVSGGGTGQPCPDTPTVTDIDGNLYNTVLIGNQCWMKENLKTTKYRNGTSITYPGSNNTTWQNNTTGAYAWYNNDISWKNSYGALYNWYAVNNANGLCPTGWHVPSNNELNTVVSILGGESVAGGKMKSAITSPSPHPRWDAPNNAATNESGFSAFPGGDRAGNADNYSGMGTYTKYWSSTSFNQISAKSLFLHRSVGSIEINTNDKVIGYSVRCLKD